MEEVREAFLIFNSQPYLGQDRFVCTLSQIILFQVHYLSSYFYFLFMSVFSFLKLGKYGCKKKSRGYSKTNVTLIYARGTPGCGGFFFSFLRNIRREIEYC